MLFIDSNDFFSQMALRKKLKTLEKEKYFYQEEIKKVKEEREELLYNEELLEKYARERYLMKRKNEDIYIIVEEK